MSTSSYKKRQGKVRDIYEYENNTVLLVTSDRVSAFDRHIANIPHKGVALTQLSLWWFDQTRFLVPNHVLSSPTENSILCERCTVFPIEFVVRGYITGSTSTSMWTRYNQGERLYCGHALPEGLTQHQRLPSPILTPTTKAEVGHDELISPQEIIDRGLMTKAEWDYCSLKALQLFDFGQCAAVARGLLLVDTKYEFGKNAAGKILIVDEIHTADSSRYWTASTYEERIRVDGRSPDSVDKDVLRNWYLHPNQRCDPYKDEILPTPPLELITQLSKTYIRLYEQLTGLRLNTHFTTHSS